MMTEKASAVIGLQLMTANEPGQRALGNAWLPEAIQLAICH